MSPRDPAVILYDSAGNAMAVQDGVAVPAGTRGLMGAGQDSFGDAHFIRTDAFGNQIVALPEIADTPYGALRASEDQTLLDLVFKYQIPTELVATDTATGGTITHEPDKSAAELNVTGSSGSRARMRTHEFFRYFSGRAILARQVLRFTSAGETNQLRRWGMFDDDDGIFWRVNGTTLGIYRRTSITGSSSETVVADQTNWNFDTMDGNGPSGITLDLTKSNMYEMQIQWYGVGARCAFFINQILVHRENFSNAFEGPFTKTFHLPLQWEVYNSGGASTGATMEALGSSVEIMGESNPAQLNFAADTGGNVEVSDTEEAVLAIRPKATFNSITNRARIIPLLAEMSADGGNVEVRVYYEATITGGTWTSVDAESHTEYNRTMTGFSGGTLIYSGFLTDGTFKPIPMMELFDQRSRSVVLRDYANTPRTVLITAEKLKAGTVDIRASINVEESV